MRNCVRILTIYLVLVMCISAFSGMNVDAEKANKKEATTMIGLPDLDGWHYKIPIIVDTGDYNRTDCVLSQTINITREIGGFGAFDNNSIRVIETLEDGTPEYESISQIRWLNIDNLDVEWIMNGTTPANTERFYSIYFDIQENGIKNATTYTECVTTSENSQHLWIYGTDYEIKIDKDRGGSRELKINNVPRKGYTLDKDWMSWYTPYINWGIKGANTTLIEDGPIYKTVKIVSSDNTQTVYWYFYPDRMKIVTEEEYDDVCFDTIADNLNNKKGTLIWSDETTEDFTKDYKEYSKNTNFFYILDPELDSANDDVKGRSGFWADTQDGRNQTVINAGEKGTKWVLDGNEAWFGFAKNEVIRDAVLRSQFPPEITREYSWMMLESPVIEDEKLFENQVVVIKGDLTVTNSGTLILIDSSLIVHGNITVEGGGELYIVSSRDLLPPKPPELPPWPPLPPIPPRPPIRPPIRSAVVAGNISVNGKLFIAKDSLSICSEKEGMNGINVNPTSTFECYNATITTFSGEIPVSITNQKICYEKYYYRFDIWGEAQIDSSKISYLYEGIRLCNDSNAIIQNCEIFNSKGDGIYIVGKTKPIIANNTIKDCSNAGIFIFDDGEEIWTKKTEMGVLPNEDGWTLLEDCIGNCASVSNGTLTIDTMGEVQARYWYYQKEWGANNIIGSTIKIRLQMVFADSGDLKRRYGFYVAAQDGAKQCVLMLGADKVGLTSDSTAWPYPYYMDTTDKLHEYVFTLKGSDVKVYVDGILRIDAVGWAVPVPSAETIKNKVYFGDTSGISRVKCYVDYIYYSTKGAFAPGYYPPAPVEGAGPWSVIATVDEVVEFDASNYYDPATIANYSWDFDAGNGVQKERYGKTVNHTYENTGIYFVTLTVIDNVGATDSCYIRVSIWNPSWWTLFGQTISNCKYGFNLSDTSLNIAECTLFNNDYGVYCNNSSATIIKSYIFDNNINSVYLSADSSMIPVNAAYDRTNVGIEKETYTNDGDDWSDEKELYVYGFSPYHKDSSDADFDGDGLTNLDEGNVYGTDPLNPDTDQDGYDDKYEFETTYAYSDVDWDGDGNLDYKTNPLNPDTDFDGLNDKYEIDTTYSYSEVDWDGDGNIDYKTSPLKPDTDEDGLLDGKEVKVYRTDPLKIDTDGDGLYDGWKDDNRNMIWDQGERCGEIGDPNQQNAQGRNLGSIAILINNPAENPDPLKKDIYVEVDRMGEASWRWGWHWFSECGYGTRCAAGGAAHYVGGVLTLLYTYSYYSPCGGHTMSSEAKTTVIKAFSRHNIALHIDDGAMGGGTSVTHDDELDYNTEWDIYYNNYFTANRRHIFHHCIMCHLEINDPWDKDILGRGECPGDAFVLYDQNLGGTWPWTDRTTMQAHVFMHEIGHNLLGYADHLDGIGHCSHTCAMQTNLNPWDTHAIDYCGDCWADLDLAKEFRVRLIE